VPPEPAPGQIVILNGAPRSGKTSISAALLDQAEGVWVNLGVDASVNSVSTHVHPGLGLRPGGERPDLEGTVAALSAALFESVAAHARLGLCVAVDLGLHEDYASPRRLHEDGARRLAGLPVLFVGVRCPLEVVWERRAETWGQRRDDAAEDLLAAVARWQEAVHAGRRYDLEVDTSTATPAACAYLIETRLAEGPPGSAFWEVASAQPRR
jgi:chloramphenicol 3-O phosphotransferase